MIYTSYFAKLNKLPENVIPITICGKSPSWYHGLEYKKLAPKYVFFKEWKENQDNNYYIKCFNEQVLSQLSQEEVLRELYDLLNNEQKEILKICNCPFQENPHIHIALICYEKPESFCHRHLVAEWLNKEIYTKVEEYKF